MSSSLRYVSVALKRTFFSFLVFTFVLVPASLVSSARAQTNGAKNSGAYYTGVYPNLFTQLLGKSRKDVREKVDAAFNQLFFGNDSTQRVYYPAAGDMGYVEDIASNDVRTEGMSYGMMIAVQMNRKDVFNRIWKWAMVHMHFNSGPHKGFFAWHCRPDGTVLDSNSASDGEQWFAMALFLASKRWSSDSVESDRLDEGNGEGIFDYGKQAQDILNTMLHKESEPGHGSVTDMFNKNHHLVVFVPHTGANNFTDPSYQLPAYYELWARWADRDSQFWQKTAAASREFLKDAANPATGLCSDYAHYDGKPINPWPGGHEDFRYDAWRVGMNVAVDHVWFARDKWEVTECNRLLNFFYSQGMDEYGDQYSIDGKELSNQRGFGLIAMNGVAALASTSPHRKDFVKALWDMKIPAGKYRYYGGMLYMLAMLQVSGNFRIYGVGK